MVTAFCFSASCPHCGGDLAYVNGAHPSSLEAKAVCRCLACDKEWLIAVSMQPVEPIWDYGDPPCGTNAAYMRHRRLREPVDESCRAAHRRSMELRAEREGVGCGVGAAR